jgi:hypothetical protein
VRKGTRRTSGPTGPLHGSIAIGNGVALLVALFLVDERMLRQWSHHETARRSLDFGLAAARCARHDVANDGVDCQHQGIAIY